MDNFFLKRIVDLHQKGDTAKLASLRRAAGETLGAETARNVYWVYSYFGGTPKEGTNPLHESAHFLAGTLLAFDRDALEGRANAHDMTFAATLRNLTGTNNDTELEKHPLTRRFRILLDADWSWDGTGGSLPFRLRQMARYAIQKDAHIAWDRLLKDLLRWNHPERYVQKRWARDYFAPYLPADALAGSETTATLPDAE